MVVVHTMPSCVAPGHVVSTELARSLVQRRVVAAVVVLLAAERRQQRTAQVMWVPWRILRDLYIYDDDSHTQHAYSIYTAAIMHANDS